MKPPKPKESAQARVARAVRDAIFSGQLQPGDPIQEMHLARQNHVSQTTAREALAKLEQAGLVRRVANVGTFVTQLSPREIREFLRLRVMLEGLAAMEAARLISERHFGELDAKLAAISKAVERNDYFEAAQADLEFHRYVWERSGDRTLYRMLDQLTVPLFVFVSLERQRVQEDLTDAVRSHAPIVAALKGSDPLAAQEAMRSHIEQSYAEFIGTGNGDRYILSPA
jgi:GntR family transcriptional regulator, rspAB operon transcriptional repressor